jgi:parallel beta-helix repeat protein
MKQYVFYVAVLALPLVASGAAPSAVSVSPSTGTGASQLFTLQYSSPSGWSALVNTDVMFNSSLSGGNACLLLYEVPSKRIYLYSDIPGNGMTGPVVVNSNGSLSGNLSNAQCTMNGTGSSVTGSGTTLTMALNMSFSTANFSGTKNTYMYTSDNAGLSSGWQKRGTWTIQSSTSPPPSGDLSVMSFGAKGDGVANDTAAFNAALKTACGGSTNLHIPAGTYLLDSLDLLNACGITIYGDGNTATILRINSVISPVMWRFASGSGKTLTIQDLAMDGRHQEVAGITIDSYATVDVYRVNIHDFGTPGYAEGHQTELDGLYITHSTNVNVTNSLFTGNERTGIELQGDHNTVVSGSTMSGNGHMAGVSEQTFAGTLDGPLVAQWLNNTMTSNGSGGIDVETDPSLPAAQGIIQGNKVINCGNDNWGWGWGLVIGLRAYGTISGNEVDNYAANVPSSDYTNAIVFGTSAGAISITNNTVTGTKTYAIVGDSVSYPVTISGNTLSTQQTGIFLYDVPGVSVTNNTVSYSQAAGISVYWSNGYTVRGNVFTSNNPDLLINGQFGVQN